MVNEKGVKVYTKEADRGDSMIEANTHTVDDIDIELTEDLEDIEDETVGLACNHPSSSSSSSSSSSPYSSSFSSSSSSSSSSGVDVELVKVEMSLLNVIEGPKVEVNVNTS